MAEFANVSRRNLIKGMAAAGGVAALGGLAGCSAGGAGSESKEDAQAAAGEKHTWETKPEPIADIAETIDTEVLIVGGGYAGCCCAYSAAENGLQVTLVEKSGTVNGNGIGGTGATASRAMDALGVKVDLPEERQRWLTVCGERVRGSLVSKFFRESERCMNWLLDLAEKHGAECMVTVGCEGKVWHEVANYHWLYGGDLYDQFGPATFVENIFRVEAEELGAKFVFNTPAVQLVQDENGAVTGAICESDGKHVQYNASKAVVLATGDVSYNDEYMDHFVPIINKAKRIQTILTNTGDGHNMAAWAGAALQDGPWATCMDFQGGAMFRGPFMLVTPEGERCVNEGDWGQYACIAVLKDGKTTEAWSVFDSNWEGDLVASLKYGGGGFWDTFRPVGSDESLAASDYRATIEDGLANDPDNYKRADTLEELADMMGVDKQAFLAQVEKYNGYCDAGYDPDFFKEPGLLFPIKEGPFYALREIPAMLTTMSGIHISDDFEVLTADDEAIPGLYAIGNCSGDMYAIDYPISLQGNSHGHCLVMGKCLGEQLAGVYKETA